MFSKNAGNIFSLFYFNLFKIPLTASSGAKSIFLSLLFFPLRSNGQLTVLRNVDAESESVADLDSFHLPAVGVQDADPRRRRLRGGSDADHVWVAARRAWEANCPSAEDQFQQQQEGLQMERKKNRKENELLTC